ncbi:heme exporter protein CcmD [Pseudomonas sp. F1_0610]|uniref:heme exporter protein CcmD n=1 Tax=Pseudomonas sp. F1_0610 TaxID=3114284 RepID=UPI0039C2C8E6
MYFSSFSDFLAMGNHGFYVWLAFGITFAVMIINLLLPIISRGQYLKSAARQLRRETVR